MILAGCEIFTALNFEKFLSNSWMNPINVSENLTLFGLAYILLILSVDWHLALIISTFLLTGVSGV